MRTLRSALIVTIALLVALPVAAETGNFSSFSTTVTGAGDTLNFNLTLTTAGPASPSTYDPVFFYIGVGRVDNAYPNVTFYDSTLDYRGSVLSNTTFSASFSFSGLTSYAYKYGAVAVYAYGGFPYSPFRGLVDLCRYSSFTAAYPTFANTCWYTFAVYTWYPFLSGYGGDVSSGSTMANLTTVQNGGNRLNMAVVLGRQELHGRPIPTAGTVGLLVLGALLAGAGIFILRRA